MISIRNVEKYLQDHGEIPQAEKDNLLAVFKVAAENGLVTGGMTGKILGPRAKAFFQEIESDPEHIQIGLEDIAIAKKRIS
jgi:hypothetical protein